MSYHRDSKRFAAREVYQIQDTLYEAIPCTYCGLPVSDREHVFPQAYQASVPEILGVPFASLAIVPSCKECNSLSGQIVFKGIQDKRQYVHEKLKQRYRKVLEIPAWSESELNELSPELAQYVHLGLQRKAIILRRLTWQTSSVPVSNAGKPFSRRGHHKNFVRGNVGLRSTTQKSMRPLRELPVRLCKNCQQQRVYRREARYCDSCRPRMRVRR